MPGYVYRGTGEDVMPDAVLADDPTPPLHELRAKGCGTEAGYHRHHRNREEPCDPCKAAHADYNTPGARGARAVARTARAGIRV